MCKPDDLFPVGTLVACLGGTSIRCLGGTSQWRMFKGYPYGIVLDVQRLFGNDLFYIVLTEFDVLYGIGCEDCWKIDEVELDLNELLTHNSAGVGAIAKELLNGSITSHSNFGT